MILARCAALLLFPTLLLAQLSDLPKWNKVLDNVSALLSAKRYLEADRELASLSGEFFRQFRNRTAPPSMPPGEGFSSEPEILAGIERLRKELTARDISVPFKTTLQLGSSLYRLYRALPPETRYQQMTASAAKSQNPNSPLVRSQLMLTAYQARRLDHASSLASQLIADRAQFPQFDQYVHYAYSMLGLIALDQKQPEVAKTNLLNSVSTLTASEGLALRRPNLALADAILQSGDKATVLAFLDAAINFPGWASAKPRLTDLRQAVASGQRTTFAPDNLLTF